MQVKFEFVGEDHDYPGAKIYNVKAITVTTTRNQRRYSESELAFGARSLSFRPLNRNHESDKTLAYPANETLVMDYNKEQLAVTGKMRIADPAVQKLIEEGKINKLSIEQIPYKGEACSLDNGVCEQQGVIFTGMALLDYNVVPGDENTEIKAESIQEVPLYEMVDLPRCSCCNEEGQELGPKAAARPDSHFAFVPKGGNPSDRKLPIYDAPHARNALARFNQTNLPSNAKAAVYQKIKKAAKKFGVQVSDEEQTNYASKGFAGYDDLDDCVNQNQDQGDPYGYCTRLMNKLAAVTGMGMQVPGNPPNNGISKNPHNLMECPSCIEIQTKYSEFFPKKNDEEGAETGDPADKKGKGLSIDDIRNYWNSLNDSQRSHVIDPNDHYPNTPKFAKKKWDDMTQDQQTAMIKTFGFRHSWNDIKKLLPKGQQDPDAESPVMSNDLMGMNKNEKEYTEKDLKNDIMKLIKAGIKDPVAWSMAMQNPQNRTEIDYSIAKFAAQNLGITAPLSDGVAKNINRDTDVNEALENIRNAILTDHEHGGREVISKLAPYFVEGINELEKSSLNSETSKESQMSQQTTGAPNADKKNTWSSERLDALKQLILTSKWPMDKIEKFAGIMRQSEGLKKEVDSMISAFVGLQNNKAPLSDKLAGVLLDASDWDLDNIARVTMDQQPSVIPTGGLPDYKAFTQEFWKGASEVWKSSQQEMIAQLGEKLITIMKTKTEAAPPTPSSVVSDQQQVRQEKARKMYEFYDIKGFPDMPLGVPFKYSLDKNEYLTRYGAFQTSGSMDLGKQIFQRDTKGEAVTVTSGDMGQTFAKQVMLLPGGRMRVPVRQYCNFTEIPNGADRANWYTIGSFTFGAVTEGTEPTNVSQTVTKKQALPSITGAVQRVGYSQIENAPFGMVDSINNAMVLAGLHDEASNLLGSSGSFWGTPSNVTNWVNGNSGESIVSQDDDIGSMTVTRSGLIAAKRLIAAGGYDTSPGNLVLFCHPKSYQDLMLDTNLNTYYQYARPDITTTYVLEQLYGVDIVPTTAVAGATNTTNPTWRNVLAVKGWALGMAAAREITIEVQRRNEVQQLIVSGMHRVQSVVIDYSAACGISGAQ